MMPNHEELLGNFAGMNLSEEKTKKLNPKEKQDMYSVTAKDGSRMNHRYFFLHSFMFNP